MSLKNKLHRIKKHITSDVEQKREVLPTDKIEADVDGSDIPFIDEWRKLGAKPYYFEGDYIMIREKEYPLNHQHGLYHFSELSEVNRAWEERNTDHPLSSKGISGSNMIFFDTETTGLGGGVGNTIFLLGYSQVFHDRVLVKQFFLPDPSSEVALYQAFLHSIHPLKRLVTYNGKAFDWPQVKTRHTLIRNELPKLPSFGHFDLLHASRRLWKEILPSCRLAVVEEEILKYNRENDTPGYLAPMYFFDFLREKDPNIIEGVIQHNEWDVLSLISLYIHLSKLLLHFQPERVTAKENYEMGRWFDAMKDYRTAAYFYKCVLQQGGILEMKAKFALAMIYKKQKDFQKACTLWVELSKMDQEALSSKYALLADVELSMWYEHQVRDVEKALHYALKAYDHWKKGNSIMKKKNQKEKSQFIKRIERLEKKQS